MIKRLKILSIADPAFKVEVDKITLPFGGNLGPLRDTLTALQIPPWAAVTALFEYDYVDRDYQDEFSAFYSKAFKAYPSRCTRLHFFSCPISPRIRQNFGRFRKHYLGFIVLRPTDLQRMGRTVLVPSITDANREFIHCTAPFSSHLVGDEFFVEGMPFVQQDTQVGACAQASLWMVARYMARRFGHREFLPSEINHLAKSKSAHGRAFPAEFGLTGTQMLDALDGMGFFAWGQSLTELTDCAHHVESAFPVDLKASKSEIEAQLRRQCSAKLADITYRYIESGLPVILTTHNHALVAIGHTYDPTIKATVAIQRIPDWIVHNDNTGPYIRMPLFTSPPPRISFSQVRGIIAIAPREVTLRGEEAETMASQSIEELLNQNTDVPVHPTWRDLFTTMRPDLADCIGQLEYRTFLSPSVDFQTQLKRDIKEGRFHSGVGEKILQFDFPRYIWITEVSSPRLLNYPDRGHRHCLGRVIVDSTAPAKTRGQMIIHFCDFLRLSDRQGDQKRQDYYAPGSTTFGHKIVS